MDVRPGENGFAENFASLQNFVVKRVQWLDGVIGKWSADHADPLGDYMDVFGATGTMTRSPAPRRLACCTAKVPASLIRPALRRAHRRHRSFIILPRPAALPIPTCSRMLRRGSWYAPAVALGAARKIILGYDDGLFRPDRGVSREDMITLLYRYAGSPKTSGRKLAEFRDNASISDYARQAMEWAVENGLILGYAEDGTIRPQSTTTRAEFATIAVRFYEKTNA